VKRVKARGGILKKKKKKKNNRPPGLKKGSNRDLRVGRYRGKGARLICRNFNQYRGNGPSYGHLGSGYDRVTN